MPEIKRPKLSVVIPVFNEMATVEQAVRRIYDLDIDKEIIVIDDFSTDGSRELLKKLQPELKLKLILHAQNRGKGAGVANGVAHAKGQYLLVEDADLELDPQEALQMLKLLETNPKLDLINGKRKLTGVVGVTWATKLARIVTHACMLVLFQRSITDILCGYKICKLEKFKSLQINSHRFGIEAEWLVKAIKNGWKIVEYPISYKPRGHKAGKKINLWDGFDIVWKLVKLRFARS